MPSLLKATSILIFVPISVVELQKLAHARIYIPLRYVRIAIDANNGRIVKGINS